MRSYRGVTFFGVATLLWASVYLARTQAVVGPWVARQIKAEALNRKIDIQVGEFTPHGFLSIAFQDVSVRVPTGKMAVEMHFDEVVVSPSWEALLQGKAAAGGVTASTGKVRLRPWNPVRETPTPKPATPPSSSPKPAKKKSAEPTALDVTMVDVDLDVVGPLQTTAPLRVERAEFTYKQGRVFRLSGYGALPDGVRAAARTVDTTEGSRTEVKFDRPTHVETWFSRELPVKAVLGGFQICPNCDEVVTVNDVIVSPRVYRPDLRLAFTVASLTRTGETFELTAAEVELENATKDGFGARIMRTRLEVNARKGTSRVRTKLVDPSGGSLDVDASWEDGLDVTVFAEAFDSTSVARFVDLDRFEFGTLDGTVRLNVDLNQQIVDVETALRLRGPVVDAKRLSKVPLRFPQLTLNMHALADIKARALSVSKGQLALGPAAGMSFNGALIDAGKGWRFNAYLNAQNVDAVAFRDGLPTGVREVAEGAILDGSFSVSLDVKGHTAYPNALVIEGDLDGDVAVLRDGTMDVRSLTTNGAPPQLEKADLDVWRSYSDLPAHVPRVLLAAEDAAFFGHPGFDWSGLRAAMVHNIEAGSLERGGSTISQQVAKNLFLSPERTVARKLQEAYLTWRMESEVPKERILEIYMNLADWGGAVGIERAAKRYFGVGADQLQVPEVAMLAAILPNPTRFGSKIRKGTIDRGRAEKIQRILNNLRFLGVITYSQFLQWNAEVGRGQIGRLTLTIVD